MRRHRSGILDEAEHYAILNRNAATITWIEMCSQSMPVRWSV
jgi:hypothetical protein